MGQIQDCKVVDLLPSSELVQQQACCPRNLKLREDVEQVRALSRADECAEDPAAIWLQLRQALEWRCSPETRRKLSATCPQVARWSLELRVPAQASFLDKFQVEVLIGSRHDGRSTFSTQPDRGPESCASPQLRIWGEGGFEVRVFPLYINEAFRGALASLTRGAINAGCSTPWGSLRSGGRGFEFALTGVCAGGKGLIGDLKLTVKWLEAGTLCRATLSFRRDLTAKDTM